MTSLLLLFLMSSVLAINHPTQIRTSHPYEFVRPGSRKGNELGSKAPVNQYSRADKHSFKKVNGVPPYAVLMEPLVKYSQPDPLYTKSKEPIIGNKDSKQIDTKAKREENKENTPSQISQKTGHISPYEDSEVQETGFHLLRPHPPPRPHHHHRPHHQIEYSAPGILYEGPIPEEPEPIIEIIIKESNQSLPTPPPLPTPPKKKKKEHVQVFYVKYKKDPSSLYGEDKIIYDPPVPAITPPTNNANPEHEEVEEEPYQHHEEVTLPPKPSTTLKAIIKPDSEQYHGSGGIHITFGQPSPEEGGHGHDDHHHAHHAHHRDNIEESAPQPAVLLPPKGKVSATPKIGSQSQLTKRNPAPFHSQTQPPQPSFNNPSVSTPREFQRPTPLPSFQQAPQFPAQPFKPQLTNTHPVVPTPPRPSPTLRYSTLPQHLQQFPKPQTSFSFPPRPQPPQQPIPQSTNQQFYSINQPHLKASFQANVRPTSPQQYHTISNQAAQQHSFPKNQPFPPSPSPPTFHQAPKPFPQPTRPFPPPPQPFPQPSNTFPQPSNSFPHPNTFSQVPQQVVGPIIQRTQVPALPQPNVFQNGPVLQQQPPQPVFQQQIHHRQPQPIGHQQQQHHQQVEQLNRLQQQQQRLQSQILDQQKQNFQSQQRFQQTTYAPEILRSVSPELPFTSHRFETKKPQFVPTSRPSFQQSDKSSIQYSKNFVTTTESSKKYTQTTTQAPIEYVTEDPKKAEEERRKKEERKKQNVAALPKEVPDDLREQLLSSGILGNADIQILDYDKIGDIPIESLPPEALANFQAVAGSEPVPSIVRPDSNGEDAVAEASETSSVIVPPARPASDLMEMKVVRYNPDSKEGAQVAKQYMQEGATQLEPVVLNDAKYNRYLPLKVAGAQFPVPDVVELRGKNVTSVVVLAPVDYEFLQRHDDFVEDGRAGRRSSHPVLEVQGVHFVAGDVLKTLVRAPTSDNYKKWLEKENQTSLDKQSVVLLVVEPRDNITGPEKEIYMYDIGSRKVSKLSGELSAQFVEVAESNSENEDLEEISDVPGGDFTVKDAAGVSPTYVRNQRKATGTTIDTSPKTTVRKFSASRPR